MVRRYMLLRDVCLFLGGFSMFLAPFGFCVSPVGFFLFLVDGVAYFVAAMYFGVKCVEAESK
jgi:ABC-type polysaccharide/polyol phosphate export permease